MNSEVLLWLEDLLFPINSGVECFYTVNVESNKELFDY